MTCLGYWACPEGVCLSPCHEATSRLSMSLSGCAASTWGGAPCALRASLAKQVVQTRLLVLCTLAFADTSQEAWRVAIVGRKR